MAWICSMKRGLPGYAAATIVQTPRRAQDVSHSHPTIRCIGPHPAPRRRRRGRRTFMTTLPPPPAHTLRALTAADLPALHRLHDDVLRALPDPALFRLFGGAERFLADHLGARGR